MLTIFPILMLAFFAICMLAAAWPLLAMRVVRPAVLGVTGSSCVLAGAVAVGLVAAGLIGPGESLAQAAADETAPEAADSAADSSAPDSSAPDNGSSAQAAETEPLKAESSPEIVETPPEIIGAIIYPTDRPRWVEDDPQTTGSGVHTIPVSSGPHTRHSDAVKYLNAELEKATDEYIANHVGSQLGPTFLRYDARTIKERFVKRGNLYEEEIVVSLGPMQQAHALIEFTPAFRAELDERWEQVRAKSRLGQLGLFAGAGLLLLGSVFSYFRLDNATRGYYTGRLQFMAAAAILAVIGGGAFAARWITWL